MQAPLPNKISCFFSTCVSSDNSFLSIRQEPTYFFMVLPLFPNLALVHCGWRKPTCPVVFWLRHVRKYYTLVQFRDSNRITCFSWPLSLHLLCNVRTAWLIVFIFEPVSLWMWIKATFSQAQLSLVWAAVQIHYCKPLRSGSYLMSHKQLTNKLPISQV